MKVINMTYNPITGAQYDTVEIPDQEITTSHNAKAAAKAYEQTQKIRKNRATRLRSYKTKRK